MSCKKLDPRVVAYFDKYFKWSIASMCDMDGDMPIVKGSHTIPKCVVSFLDIKKKLWHGAHVHFFHNDYKFDGEKGIWADTTRHLPMLENFKGILSPDFSLYRNAGRIPQLWNTYRNRLVQCHLERLGFDVIPTVSWGTADTFDFCFKGLPQKSVLAVSTLGVMNDKEGIAVFEAGYRKMCSDLSPEFVVLYGSDKGLSLGDVPYRSFHNGTYDWTDSINSMRKAS